MSKILQMCPCAGSYHAVFVNPEFEDDETGDAAPLIYVDIPMFALIESGAGKTEICPMIMMRNGELTIAWEAEDYIGSSPVEFNDDDYWIGMHEEAEEERQKAKKIRSKPHKGKKAIAAPVGVTDDDDEEEEEEEEDEDDDEPQGKVHLPAKKR
jgi:hypothetical protein